MSEQIIKSLRKGDRIRVTFGSRGSRLAEVTHEAKQGKYGLYIKAKKFNQKRGNWTSPVSVYAGEIIGRYTFTPQGQA